MVVKVQRNQIKYYKDHETETGVKDLLQLGIEFVGYPDLPTYGIMVDVTGLATPAQIKSAIIAELQVLQVRVYQQIQNDETARQYFDSWGWTNTEFEIDNL